ncbi:MAG: hypothetical protein QOK31_1021 [Solirubrobacteraceae bacterium]|jgi:hypothetical protein|nr:hypothetical protein [Solirubrobacteraceae bacterium]
MGSSTQLVLVGAAIHLAGLLLAVVLLLPILRGDHAASRHSDEGDEGGGSYRREPPRPSGPDGGGLPLPDARPARVRLRGPARLADLRPAPARRPAREPAPGPRVPVRR